MLKTKAMTRFRGQRPQLLMARSTAVESTPSLRRRRSRRTPASRPDSAYQTEAEEVDDRPDDVLVARPASRASSRSVRSDVAPESEEAASPADAPDTPGTPQPPAYFHGRSPSYSRSANPLSARRMEKQRAVEADPAVHEQASPALEADDVQEGVSGHLATDDKAVLEAMRHMTSRPAALAEEDEAANATAPHIALDVDGFEVTPIESDELSEPSEPPPVTSEADNPFPAPPQAIAPTFTGLAAPSEPILAPSAPDFTLEDAEEASAPMPDDLPEADDMEAVIGSSAGVSWLPIYEASSSRTGAGRAEHAVV
jgi:hypothetical protein